MLVAVFHQDIEIGIHQRCLVAVAHPERCRLDVVNVVGFIFQLRIRGGIHDFHMHSALARNFVFAQQILHLGHERRKQRVRLLAEITPDQQRFLQLRQIVAGRIRY